MDKNFTNIDSQFRDAFENWEAGYSPSEMQADWSSVSKQIPHTPVQSLPHNPGMGLGKMLGITGIGAVVTTAAILIYNTYSTSKPVTESKPLAKTEQTIQPETPAQANSNTAEQLSAAGKSDKTAIVRIPAAEQNNKAVEKAAADKQPASHTGDKANINSVAEQNTNNAAAQTNAYNGSSKGSNENAASPIVNKPNPADNLKAVLAMPQSICMGKNFAFSLPQNAVADVSRISWGDGRSENARPDNTHVYTNAGTYTVSLMVGNEKVERQVKVQRNAEAHFEAIQTEALSYSFKNNSIGGADYIWDFGDGSRPVHAVQPEHRFTDTGTYRVKLIAVNTSDCTDTLIQDIYVSSHILGEVQNGITPNGDGYNDEFVIPIENEDYFHLVIMDGRTGETIFESRNKDDHWKGTDPASMRACTAGNCLFVYILKYKFAGEDKIQTKSGPIYLVR